MGLLKRLFKICEHDWVFDSIPFLVNGGASKRVFLRCTKCGKETHKDLFSKLVKKSNKSYIFCPVCGNELLHKEDCFIDKVNDISTFKCNECFCESDWYMDSPVPIRVPRKHEKTYDMTKVYKLMQGSHNE